MTVSLVSTPGAVGPGAAVQFTSSLAVAGDFGYVQIETAAGVVVAFALADINSLGDCVATIGADTRAFGFMIYPGGGANATPLPAPGTTMRVNCQVFHGIGLLELATFASGWTWDPTSALFRLFPALTRVPHDPVLDQILIAVQGHLQTLP
jgi:hypothetical protein